MLQKFYDTLFDQDDLTCFTQVPTGAASTKCFPVKNYRALTKSMNFFCINPLSSKNLDITKDYHHFEVPCRSDGNVTKFRNILIESDKLNLRQQLEFVKASQMPFSTVTFSGSKSFHFIISLDTPLASRDEYRVWVKALYLALSSLNPDFVDFSCGNPSRLSRMPEATRLTNGKIQKLHIVRSRVNNNFLKEWILNNGGNFEGQKKIKKYVYSPIQQLLDAGEKPKLIYLKKDTKDYLEGKKYIEAGARNNTVYKLACDFFRKGFNFDETILYLQPLTDLSFTEIKNAILSAECAVVNHKENS